MKKIIKLIIAISAVLCLGLIYSESGYESGSRLFFSMDTVINFSIDAKKPEEKLDRLENIIKNLDSELSRTEEGSLIYRLNNSVRATAQLGEDAVLLLNEASELRDFTDGNFDISIAPLMDLWGFTSGEYRVPEDEEIEKELLNVGMEHIHLKNDMVSLDAGSKLDLGGIAKGYGLEKSLEFFEENHVKRGIAYLGGDILAYGSRSGTEPWSIAIEDPDKAPDEKAYLGTVNVRNSYVMTSGNYQRFFISDNVRYHHILDPRTGRPADTGINSVSIVADAKGGSGAMCDALSTALFVMGRDKAVEFWRANPNLFDFIIVTEDNEIFISKGLEKTFIPAKNEKYTCITVER